VIVTINPVEDHVAFFIGSTPHRWNGEKLTPLAEANLSLANGRIAHFSMSLKCPTADHYPDYYAKVEYHIQNIETEAKQVDPAATAQTRGPCIIKSDEWPFEYADTASWARGNRGDQWARSRTADCNRRFRWHGLVYSGPHREVPG